MLLAKFLNSDLPIREAPYCGRQDYGRLTATLPVCPVWNWKLRSMNSLAISTPLSGTSTQSCTGSAGTLYLTRNMSVLTSMLLSVFMYFTPLS